MITRCNSCGLIYDDTYRWTYCPHDSFEMRTLAVKPNGEEKVCRTVEELDEFFK